MHQLSKRASIALASAIAAISCVPFKAQCIAGPFDVIPYVLTDTDGALGPNLEDRVVFRSVANPTLNSSGSMAFSGLIEGPDIQGPNNQGIWTATTAPDSATIVARTGTARELGPGLGPGIVFDSFRAPFYSHDGDVTFHAFALQGGVGSPESWDGIWRIPAGQPPVAISVTGDDDLMGPGLGDSVAFRIIDGTFSDDVPWSSADGDIAFFGVLEGRGIDSTNDTGLWKSDASRPAVAIALEGSDGPLGPGLGPGVTFVDLADVAVSSNGDTVARAIIQGPGVTRENDEIVWVLERNNTRRTVIRTGDEVMVDQVTSAPITDLGQTRVADDGTVLFFSRISDDVPGIWQDGPGVTIRPRILADTDGDLGPGLGPDVVFRSFSQFSASANGDFSVFAHLQEPLDDDDATTDRGVWSVSRDGHPRLVARNGQDIPPNAGLGSGFSLKGIGDSIATEFGIVFGGRLDGPQVDGDNDSALFVALDDNMRLVLRKGDTVDVDTGAGIDPRRISEFEVPGFFEGDGRPQAANRHGQFVVKLRFDDGNSGLFTVTVPEPAAETLALVGAILGGIVAGIPGQKKSPPIRGTP